MYLYLPFSYTGRSVEFSEKYGTNSLNASIISTPQKPKKEPTGEGTSW